MAPAQGAAAEEPAADPAAAAGSVDPARAAAPTESPVRPPDLVLEPEGYRWRGPPSAEPDWRGARSDALYFLSYQIVGVAVLYMLPQSMSGWSSEQKSEYSFDQWRENVSHPVTLDGDKWYINYVLHPYWGAAYHIRARERGLSASQSFLYSTLLSALWEYGAEALAEPVSIQDLVITPVLGSLLGEYVFAPWRERIRAKEGELDWSDHAVLALTDPLGAINAKVNQWFGLKTTMQLQPMVARTTLAPRERSLPAHLAAAPPPSRSAWRLQLRVDW
jgi:hypothetical protein